jgi:hypothetical protein
MYTKIIKNNFIVGIGLAQIDPEATKKAIKGDIEKSSEFKNLNKKIITMGSLTRANYASMGDDKSIFYQCAKRRKMQLEEMNLLINFQPSEAESRLNADEIEKRKKVLSEMKTRYDQIGVIQSELKGIAKEVEKKRKNLVLEKPVYFEYPDSEKENREVKIDDAEKETIKTALGALEKGERLNADMTVNTDLVIEPVES